jgi:hypothetical protein
MSSKLTACALATLAMVSLGTVSARAQDDRGVVVFAQGGGYSPVTDLNDAGTASFKTGFVVGGGIGYQFNRYVVARGNFNFARTEAQAPGSAMDATKYNRFLYDADLQLRYPFPNGVTPYVFGGGGAVTIKQDVTSATSFTKPAGKFGVGLAYQFPHSGASLFAEGTGWAYNWDKDLNPRFDKTQVDIAWTAGLSYRFGH